MASSSLARLKNLPIPDLASLKALRALKLKLPKSLSWTTAAIPSFLIYTLLCNFLRMKRRNAMQKKYGYNDRESFSRMTNVDAQAIMHYLGQLEFPRLYVASLQFALFKVLYSRGLLLELERWKVNVCVDLRHSYHMLVNLIVSYVIFDRC